MYPSQRVAVLAVDCCGGHVPEVCWRRGVCVGVGCGRLDCVPGGGGGGTCAEGVIGETWLGWPIRRGLRGRVFVILRLVLQVCLVEDGRQVAPGCFQGGAGPGQASDPLWRSGASEVLP